MAADTSAKRYSGINIGSAWRGLNVVPNVAIPQGERQAAMFMYSGILAGEQVVEEEEGIGLEAVRRPVDFVIQSPLWRQGFVKLVTEGEKEDQSEFEEMMKMYTHWKRAGHG